MATTDVTGSRERVKEATYARPSPQTVGGVSAIIEGLCYIGSLLLVLVAMPAMGWQMDYWEEPTKAVPFVHAHQTFFILAALFYVVSALVVLPVVVAVHERLRSLSPTLIAAASALGVMATAMLLLNALVQYAEFRAIGTLSPTVAEQARAYGSVAYDATFQAASVCLGIWVLLLSWVVIRRGAMPRWLGYFGLLVGAADIAALFFPPPSLLLSIPWLIALGIVLLRGGSHVRA
jgi:hypothetical protein